MFSLVGTSPSLLGVRTADWLRGEGGGWGASQPLPLEHNPVSKFLPPHASQQTLGKLLTSASPTRPRSVLLLPSDLQSIFLVPNYLSDFFILFLFFTLGSREPSSWVSSWGNPYWPLSNPGSGLGQGRVWSPSVSLRQSCPYEYIIYFLNCSGSRV